MPGSGSSAACGRGTTRRVADALALETMPLRSSQDVVRARQRVRDIAVGMGFSLVEQTKLVTAASELARNTVEYGRGGDMTIERVDAPVFAMRYPTYDPR